MPARKKDKNKTGTGFSRPEENIGVSTAAFERGYEAGEVSSPFPGDPGPGRKYASGPNQTGDSELDGNLILTYLACDRLLEQALLRAGFAGAASRSRQVRPDWYRWARHIEKQFDPASSEALQASVAHLLVLQDEEEARPVRRQNRLHWESGSPYSDLLWLADMLQQTRMQLTCRYNFPETPGCDTAQVMAALMVVEAWLQLVPER